MEKVNIRPITKEDNHLISQIIRDNLQSFHLDIPGTAYFDPQLDDLYTFYSSSPKKRAYFIATLNDHVIGGVGVGEFDGFHHCAEIQKLYLCDEAKGKGIGIKLMETVEQCARKLGYETLYLETHTNLKAAIGLYEKLGYKQIEKPQNVLHTTMNRFYFKNIRKKIDDEYYN